MVNIATSATIYKHCDELIENVEQSNAKVEHRGEDIESGAGGFKVNDKCCFQYYRSFDYFTKFFLVRIIYYVPNHTNKWCDLDIMCYGISRIYDV